MSIWLRRGSELLRWNGYRLFDSPPVLAPPAWALCERIWDAAELDVPSPVREPDLDRKLDALARPETRHACVVVPDATRVGPWKAILPLVLKRLSRAGRRTLLVATGTHAPVSRDRLHEHLFGSTSFPDVAAGWEIRQNSDDAFHTHRSVGTTDAGTPVRFHPDYLDSDFRVLLGGISYHYFAGFGGGPKLVFPGLGEPEGAGMNHRRALDASGSFRSECASGRLESNPVALDLREAVALAPAHAEVVVRVEPPDDLDPAVPAASRLRVSVDLPAKPYSGAVAPFDASRRLSFTCAPDLLIADAGGVPRDASFLQAHKSLQHATRFTAPGAAILWVAGCSEGWGSIQIEREADNASAGNAGGSSDSGSGRWERAVAREPTASAAPSEGSRTALHAQTLAALRRAAGDRQVALWSDLPSESVARLGMTPLTDGASARDWCRALAPEHWGWLPGAERFLPQAGWRGAGLEPE